MDNNEVDINTIKDIEFPTHEEFMKMSLKELRQWRDKLYPYYDLRSEILRDVGFEEWSKIMVWPSLYRLVERMEKEIV